MVRVRPLTEQERRELKSGARREVGRVSERMHKWRHGEQPDRFYRFLHPIMHSSTAETEWLSQRSQRTRRNFTLFLRVPCDLCERFCQDRSSNAQLTCGNGMRPGLSSTLALLSSIRQSVDEAIQQRVVN